MRFLSGNARGVKAISMTAARMSETDLKMCFFINISFIVDLLITVYSVIGT